MRIVDLWLIDESSIDEKVFLTVGLVCLLSAFIVACGVAATPTPAPTATPTPNPLLDEVARLRAENQCARGVILLYDLIDGMFSAIGTGMTLEDWWTSLPTEDYDEFGHIWMMLSKLEEGIWGFSVSLAYCFDPIVEE